MITKLKCPFCQTELEQMHDKKLLGCPKCLHIADGVFWVKAIQAKQDLEVTQKALDIANEKLRHCVNITMEELDELKDELLIAHNALLYFSKDPIAIKALKQIEHKE